MDCGEYFSFLDRLAAMDIPAGESVAYNLGKLLAAKDETAQAAVAFRGEVIGKHEEDITSAYLAIGHFREYDDIQRQICCCIVLEAGHRREITGLKKQCEPYSPEQPLFHNIPQLYEHVRKRELIDASVLKRMPNSTVVSFGDRFGYLNLSVPRQLLSWKDAERSDAPLYVRVNPYKVFNARPSELILESIVIPPNPKWWSDLRIYKRTHEGCSFQLNEDADPKENPDEFWDYHCRHIRRLDVVATRDSNGNLSMMLEELEERQNIVSPTERIVVGRMIHLDTDASFDSPFADATLNHIDLAINVYTDRKAENRMNDNLARGGRVEDASFRTHLMRVEQIPFADIFQFTYHFFRSHTLWNEWMHSQFR